MTEIYVYKIIVSRKIEQFINESDIIVLNMNIPTIVMECFF